MPSAVPDAPVICRHGRHADGHASLVAMPMVVDTGLATNWQVAAVRLVDRSAADRVG